MPEAWEITTSDQRSEDQVTTFIIFCEDENDEPFYFRSFGIENKLKINCIPNQKNKKLNLLNTLIYCKNAGLIDYIDHTYKLRENVTENIWCVYDRDFENIDLLQIKESDDLNFTTSIDSALKAGLKVAWSNDAFELWILLHFEKLPNAKVHRNYIYDRLTDIFKAYPSITEKFNDIITSGDFNYKTHLKRRVSFLNFVLPDIKEKTEQAIENAISMESFFHGGIPYHDCNPCTKVHHLVKDIISFQI